MKKLLSFCGVNLNPVQEAEMRTNLAAGLHAKLALQDGRVVEFNNLTEVHWLYPSSEKASRVALESNIHGTGYTYEVNEVASLHVDTEQALAPSI